MITKAKTPLRLSFAGGGTDIAEYNKLFTGCVVNVAINKYTHCYIEALPNNEIEIHNKNDGSSFSCETSRKLKINGEFDLVKGVYNRIVSDFNLSPPSLRISISSDVEKGSGLGGSSSLIISILNAFLKSQNISLNHDEIYKLGYSIEREYLKLPGGKQDYFPAIFGGLNFIEFTSHNKYRIERLNIDDISLNKLSQYCYICKLNEQRDSSNLIDDQINNINKNRKVSIDAMHQLKESALHIKKHILEGEYSEIADIFSNNWELKKNMSNLITTQKIDDIISYAYSIGVLGCKVSGAGGGGYLFFMIDPEKVNFVKNKMLQIGLTVEGVNFEKDGSTVSISI